MAPALVIATEARTVDFTAGGGLALPIPVEVFMDFDFGILDLDRAVP